MTPETPVQESLSPPYPIIDHCDLGQAEIDLINEIKAHAEVTRDLVERVWEVARASETEPLRWETEPLRWLNIARTHLQQGYMALTRAVAKPTTF
jgi:hypothetical protein